MSYPDKDDARQIGEKYEEDQVIVIYLDRENGEFGYASYGATSSLCGRAKELADYLFRRTRQWIRHGQPTGKDQATEA